MSKDNPYLVTQVTAWKTTDDHLFLSPLEANEHQFNLDIGTTKPEDPRMTLRQHQRLLVGVMDILNDFQFHGYGPTILDSLRGGIKELYNQPGKTRERLQRMKREPMGI